MTTPAVSPQISHKRFFFDKFGITERLLERCLARHSPPAATMPTFTSSP